MLETGMAAWKWWACVFCPSHVVQHQCLLCHTVRCVVSLSLLGAPQRGTRAPPCDHVPSTGSNKYGSVCEITHATTCAFVGFLIEPVPVLQWRAPPCVKSAATAAAAAPRRSCSQRQSLFMQSASAEGTVGLLCVLHHPSAWGQHHQNRGESVETLFLPPFFHPTLLENRWSDQKLGAFAIFAVRRHHETEEGREACREYRWEQLLTPPSRRSAARLDKAEGTSVWGFWYSSVFHSGLLITIAQFLYLIFLSPSRGWKLSVVASPLSAQRKITLEPQRNQANRPRLWHALSHSARTGPGSWLRYIRDSPGRSARPIPSRSHLRPAASSADRLQTTKTQQNPLSSTSTAELTSSTAKSVCRTTRT